MSKSDPNPNRHSAKNSGGGQPTPGTESPAKPPSTSNGGKVAKENNSRNKSHSDSMNLNACRFMLLCAQFFARLYPDRGIKEDTKNDNRYFPSLVLVTSVCSVPILTALLTVVFYLSPSPMPASTSIPVLSQAVIFIDWLEPGSVVILLGMVVALVVWLLFALPGMRFATAKGGRPSDYEALNREIQRMKAQYKVLIRHPPQDKGNNAADKDHQIAREIRLEEVKTELSKIEEMRRFSDSCRA